MQGPPDTDVWLLAAGGLDPGGGAGIVRDYLTARANGAAVRLVPTAWTEQGREGVAAVEPRPPERLRYAMSLGLAEIAQAGPVGTGAPGAIGTAVKVGLVPDAASAEALVAALAAFQGPVVFDPVLGASRGGQLYDGNREGLRTLCARATLVTPNAPEAALLTGRPVGTESEAIEAGRALCDWGAVAVLVKGGHLDDGHGPEAVDCLVTATETRAFRTPRQRGPSIRGTGCALATAIAVALGRGVPLAESIEQGKRWLGDAMARAVAVGDEWHLG